MSNELEPFREINKPFGMKTFENDEPYKCDYHNNYILFSTDSDEDYPGIYQYDIKKNIVIILCKYCRSNI